MMPAIPFAGLAPDSRTRRGSGELAGFDIAAALDVSGALRRATTGDATTAELAGVVLDTLNAYEHDARPACVLLRAFVTRRLEELPVDLRTLVRAAPGLARGANPLCLELVATRGIEPAWNEPTDAAGPRALLVEGASDPLSSELSRQLRLGDSMAPPATSFYVTAPSTTTGPPVESFVTAYGVRSVFGFGTSPWPGETVVVVGFSRVLLEPVSVRAMETVALATKAAWLETREAREALANVGQDRLRADVLAEIVALHEVGFRDLVANFSTLLRRERDSARETAAASAAQTEAHNAQLRRTQRAMLNVIDDLRDARGALESQVASRTRELALANRKLEVRNGELEEFVYIASHDLQEPLRTVGGYLQMIERRYGSKLGVEADEFIGFAIAGAQRMQGLLESLLAYSRVGTAEAAQEELELAEPLAVARKNLALRVEDSRAVIECGPLPRIHANRVQMVQLFQNLLSNALKFAGEKPPRITIASRREREFEVVSVRDEGLGFDPRFADRIFKVFRRLRRDTAGTGIGLAICKKIMERHGGRIEASAAPGAGATFTLYFPLSRATGTPA